jgi:hypothetical protein
MSTVFTPPVEDPALRRALRQLYPEVPLWMRRVLIPAPGPWPSPLPPLYQHLLDSADTVDVLERLRQTRDHLEQLEPTARWEIASDQQGGIGRQILRNGLGPTTWPRLPPGSLVAGQSNTHPQGVGKNLRTIYRGGTMHLGAYGDTGGLTEWSVSYRVGACVFGVHHRRSSTGKIVVVDRELRIGSRQIPMADGTSPGLGDHAPYDPSDIAAASHPEAIPELMCRWQGVPRPEDQARIAQFWLGHPNPALAQAGLQVLTHQRQTPRP